MKQRNGIPSSPLNVIVSWVCQGSCWARVKEERGREIKWAADKPFTIKFLYGCVLVCSLRPHSSLFVFFSTSTTNASSLRFIATHYTIPLTTPTRHYAKTTLLSSYWFHTLYLSLSSFPTYAAMIQHPEYYYHQLWSVGWQPLLCIAFFIHCDGCYSDPSFDCPMAILLGWMRWSLFGWWCYPVSLISLSWIDARALFWDVLSFFKVYHTEDKKSYLFVVLILVSFDLVIHQPAASGCPLFGDEAVLSRSFSSHGSVPEPCSDVLSFLKVDQWRLILVSFSLNAMDQHRGLCDGYILCRMGMLSSYILISICIINLEEPMGDKVCVPTWMIAWISL